MKTLTINTTAITLAITVATTFSMRDGDYKGQVLLVGKDGKLEVKSSDLMQSIIFKNIDFISSDLTDINFKSFSVDGKKFSTVLKAAKTDEVQIELNEEFIIVKSGRSKIKIDTFAKVQEINMLEDGNSFALSDKLEHIEKALHAVDFENPKYELNGMLLQIKDGVFNTVATDTKRLVAISSKTSIEDIDIIIPKKGAETFVKLFKGKNVSAKISDTAMVVFTESIEYETKLINGKFPEWQRIIPKEIAKTVTLPAFALDTLVKEASILNDDLIIEFSNNKIKIVDFEKTTVIEDDFENDANIKFGIKSKMITDFIASYYTGDVTEQITISFNESNLPIVLIADENHKEIVMPIALSTEEEIQDAA